MKNFDDYERLATLCEEASRRITEDVATATCPYMSIGFPLSFQIEELCQSLGIIGKPYTLMLRNRNHQLSSVVTVYTPDPYFADDGTIRGPQTGKITPTPGSGIVAMFTQRWIALTLSPADARSWLQLASVLSRWARAVRLAKPMQGTDEDARTKIKPREKSRIRLKRIRELAKEHSLDGAWAKLRDLANADPAIQALRLDPVTVHVARNAVQPPKQRKAGVNRRTKSQGRRL